MSMQAFSASRNSQLGLICNSVSAFIILSVISNVHAENLRVVDRPNTEAELLGITSEWDLKFRANDQPLNISAVDLVDWGKPEPFAPSSFVLLSDGSVLKVSRASEVVAIRDDRLQLSTTLWGSVSLPLESIRAVVLKPPHQSTQLQRLIHRLIRTRTDKDEVVTLNGDILRGQFIDLVDSECRFETDEPLTIDRSQIAMLTFDSRFVSAQRPKDQHAMIGMNDGSWLFAQSAVLSDVTLELQLAGRIRLRTASFVRPVADRLVRYVKPMGGRARYLSDLEPSSYKHVPFLTQTRPFGFDQNLNGESLSVNGEKYVKGIAMPSASRLTFKLDEGFNRFESELAIDDSAHSEGSVVFRLFLKTNGEWSEAFKSEIIRGGEGVKACSVPIGEAEELSLVIDFADRASVNDNANWLDARLILKK